MRHFFRRDKRCLEYELTVKGENILKNNTHSQNDVSKMTIPEFTKYMNGLIQSYDEILESSKKTDSPETTNELSAQRQTITGDLEKKLGQSFERAISISKLSDEDFPITVRHILDDVTHPLLISNFYDGQFVYLVRHVIEKSEEELLDELKDALETFKFKYPDLYNDFIEYHKTFPFWGTLSPETGDYTSLKGRIETVKRHIFDLVWLYKRLDDYLSKTTFASILFNWMYLDFEFPQNTKSCFEDYWDPDIFPDNKNDVLVDVGAFDGDSIAKYILIYGNNYKKIYAYEISPKSVEALRTNVMKNNWHDVIIRQKGAGAERKQMYLAESPEATSNRVSSDNSGVSVEIVPLDDEIGAEATFIKMDIEGAEKDALLGFRKTIASRHPKLAICTYHGYEDIWKIPYMIDKMYHGYKFYFRHYGGNLIPTEFVLLCK